jgi:hypothetical protein
MPWPDEVELIHQEVRSSGPFGSAPSVELTLRVEYAGNEEDGDPLALIRQEDQYGSDMVALNLSQLERIVGKLKVYDQRKR